LDALIEEPLALLFHMGEEVFNVLGTHRRPLDHLQQKTQF
jgi:hypothetical protein